MLKYLVKRLTQRTVVFTILLVALLVWVIRGRTVIRDISEATPAEYVAQQIKRLKQVDPEAATALTRLEEQYGARALAPTVKARSENLSTLRTWAQQAKAQAIPYEVALVKLADEARLLSNDQALDGFFYSHGTICQLLTRDPSGEALTYYLNLLRQAHADPEVWRVVRDDPIGLLLWSHINHDTPLWRFYEQERDWLAELIAQLTPLSDERDADQTVLEAVQIAERFHPLPRQAVVELETGVYGFNLFSVFGSLIEQAVEQYKLPLNETLDVLFTNADYFDLGDPGSAGYEQRIHETVQELAYIRQHKRYVWQQARLYPMALRLNRDVPQYAEKLLERFSTDDITLFLYTHYEAQLAPAAAALIHFGDLAFYLLNKYVDDPSMKPALANPKIGIRVVPFLARFGEVGFDRLDSDPRWAERYFNPDGTPRKDDWEWLQSVPILGAPGHVVTNLTQGYPLEWSEIGWAALDVADGVLLVASFGSSAGLSAAKQAVKTGGKAVVKRVAKSEAKAVTSQLAKQGAIASTKGLRAQVRQVAKQGLRQSPLRSLSQSIKLAPTGGKYVFAVGYRGFNATVHPMMTLYKTWQTVPTPVRTWTYRSLLAIGLFVTLKERTIPSLPKVGEALGTLTGETITAIVQTAGAAMAAAMRETLGLGQRLSETVQLFLYLFIGFVLLGSAAFTIKPQLQQRRAH